MIVEIDNSPMVRRIKMIKGQGNALDSPNRPKSTGRPIIKIPQLATTLESTVFPQSSYHPDGDTSVIDKCKSIIDVAKSYRKIQFNANYMERLER
jgi:hypothetical protein